MPGRFLINHTGSAMLSKWESVVVAPPDSYYSGSHNKLLHMAGTSLDKVGRKSLSKPSLKRVCPFTFNPHQRNKRFVSTFLYVLLIGRESSLLKPRTLPLTEPDNVASCSLRKLPILPDLKTCPTRFPLEETIPSSSLPHFPTFRTESVLENGLRISQGENPIKDQR